AADDTGGGQSSQPDLELSTGDPSPYPSGPYGTAPGRSASPGGGPSVDGRGGEHGNGDEDGNEDGVGDADPSKGGKGEGESQHGGAHSKGGKGDKGDKSGRAWVEAVCRAYLSAKRGPGGELEDVRLRRLERAAGGPAAARKH
ncbi:hypothetical protein ADK38_47205, partial [Streptomyces varsoviensis]